MIVLLIFILEGEKIVPESVDSNDDLIKSKMSAAATLKYND